METYGPDDYKVAIAQGRRGRNQPKSPAAHEWEADRSRNAGGPFVPGGACAA